MRGRRYGTECCGREECRGALRVERRRISSLETELVKLSRGVATSNRHDGRNCEAARSPHCGPEVTRSHALKTSRAAAEGKLRLDMPRRTRPNGRNCGVLC